MVKAQAELISSIDFLMQIGDILQTHLSSSLSVRMEYDLALPSGSRPLTFLLEMTAFSLETPSICDTALALSLVVSCN